jgi:TonB family protein
LNTKNLLIALATLFLASVPLVRAQQAQRLPPEVPDKHAKLRVSQGVMEKNLVSKVTPDYPQEAKDARIQGDVILRVTIDPKGNVSQVKPISGHPLLMQSAMDAVKQWKYKPLKLNDEPVEVETTVWVQFHM